MTDFYRILGKSGSESILFAHKASLLLDDNMLDDALNLCELGVKRYPFYAEGHYVLGRCYQMNERYDDAKNEFERALFFAPGHVKVLGALAYVFYKKKLKKMGNRCLLKNAVLEPNNKELLDYLESQSLYAQLFRSPIVESQLAADLIGFLPSEEEKRNLQERVEKTFGTSDETKRILRKEQVDLTQESYKDQDNFEISSIIDSLDEGVNTKTGLDLSQYANVDDDFSTLMGDFVTDQKSGKDNEVKLEEKPVKTESETKLKGDEMRQDLGEMIVPLPDENEDIETGAVSFSPDRPQSLPNESLATQETVEEINIDESEAKDQKAISDLLRIEQTNINDEQPAFDSGELDAVFLENEQSDEIQIPGPEPEIETTITMEDSTEDSPIDEFFNKNPEPNSDITEPVPEPEIEATIKIEPSIEDSPYEEFLEKKPEPSTDQDTDDIFPGKSADQKPLSEPGIDTNTSQMMSTKDSQWEIVPEAAGNEENKPQKTKEETEEAEGINDQDLIFKKRIEISPDSSQDSKDEDEASVSIEKIMANPSLVTPTFGEILISQRKFAEARQVFLNLEERYPDNPRFKDKVEFLDKLIKLQG